MCADLLDVGDMERALTVHISQVEEELRKLDDMKSEDAGKQLAGGLRYGLHENPTGLAARQS
jgi:hypothetical protein